VWALPLHAQNVIDILEKSKWALDKKEALNFNYRLEINYASENYNYTLEGNTDLDFRTKDNPLGLAFQFSNAKSKIVYNGSESFELNLLDKTSVLKRHPKKSELGHFTFLNMSLLTWKNVLPLIIASADIQKTFVDSPNPICYAIRIELGQRDIDKLGNVNALTAKRNISYTVLLDKKSYFPVEILQENDVSKGDYLKTQFSYNDLAKVPTERSWYFSSYPGYKIKDPKVQVSLVRGEIAPKWQLPLVLGSGSIKLDSLQGNYVLLEFWIKNCGYCIEAVPLLNEIQLNYADKGVNVIAINAGDSEADIESFLHRNRPVYTSVWDRDGKTGALYGVSGYPQAFLLDKEGRLLFQGAVNSPEMKAVLASLPLSK
jgi:thiol-disulfide isomerase/thioredoxin